MPTVPSTRITFDVYRYCLFSMPTRMNSLLSKPGRCLPRAAIASRFFEPITAPPPQRADAFRPLRTQAKRTSFSPDWPIVATWMSVPSCWRSASCFCCESSPTRNEPSWIESWPSSAST